MLLLMLACHEVPLRHEASIVGVIFHTYDELPQMVAPSCALLDEDGTALIWDRTGFFDAKWRSTSEQEVTITWGVLDIGRLTFVERLEDGWIVAYEGHGLHGEVTVTEGCDNP